VTRSGVGVRLKSCLDPSGSGEPGSYTPELRGVTELASSDANGEPWLCTIQLSSGGSCLTAPFVIDERSGGGSEVPSTVLLISLTLLTCRACDSSITARTLRSFDSDLRVGGCECLRDATTGGKTDTSGGEIDLAEEEAVEDTSAHAELDSEIYPLMLGIQPDLVGLIAISEGAISGVQELCGLGDEEGVLAMTESGGRMEKIWSPVVGGP